MDAEGGHRRRRVHEQARMPPRSIRTWTPQIDEKSGLAFHILEVGDVEVRSPGLVCMVWPSHGGIIDSVLSL